jgi:diacylglycerol kinase (ATP)
MSTNAATPAAVTSALTEAGLRFEVRDLARAARVIAQGHVLAMDVGRVHGHSFLEAGGVGLTAGLLAYFDRPDSGAPPQGVLRGVWRFVSRLGTPILLIDADGQQLSARASMVSVGNGPFVGAAYGLAPDARVDDGLLDVSVFRELPVWRVLLHLALVVGGRRRQPPPQAQTFRARRIRVATRRRRPLPVHADGSAVGGTPAEFEVLPGALRVLVGAPEQGAVCAWATESA